MRASDLFTISASFPFGAFFSPDAAPWEWVRQIAVALESFSQSEPATSAERPPGVTLRGPVHLGAGVTLPGYCTIIGPAYIGDGCEIRPGACVRGNVIAGAGCVIGNACELKNCLLMDGVQVPHFNYVGDSILGEKVHLGAGVVLSNLRLDQGIVSVTLPEGERQASGLQKLGGMLGDGAEVGCNTVLQPGTILGRRSLVMPAMAFGGYLPDRSIARVRQSVSIITRRDGAGAPAARGDAAGE